MTSTFNFYPGDRVQVVPRIIPGDGLARAFVSSFAGQRGTVQDARSGFVFVYMDVSLRPKPALRFDLDEVQVVTESIIGPFS